MRMEKKSQINKNKNTSQKNVYVIELHSHLVDEKRSIACQKKKYLQPHINMKTGTELGVATATSYKNNANYML